MLPADDTPEDTKEESAEDITEEANEATDEVDETTEDPVAEVDATADVLAEPSETVDAPSEVEAELSKTVDTGSETVDESSEAGSEDLSEAAVVVTLVAEDETVLEATWPVSAAAEANIDDAVASMTQYGAGTVYERQAEVAALVNWATSAPLQDSATHSPTSELHGVHTQRQPISQYGQRVDEVSWATHALAHSGM